MSHGPNQLWRWLAAVVVAHLALCLLHGTVHADANVPLSRAATFFVFMVILIGPIAGLCLSWPAERLGTGLIGLTMFGSLIFGVINHFVLDSPDRVANVEPAWLPLFATTAAMLAAAEALGVGLAIRVLRQRQ